jgi:acyl-CoA thioesterase-1
MKEKRIVFYGDSLTAGYGYTAEHSFPSIIKKKLDEKGFNYHVVNAGVSGETSEGGLRRIDEVLTAPIDIFILELGVNDGLRGLPLDRMKDNLQAIIDKVKARNPDVELVIAGMQIPIPFQNEYIQQFINIFPSLAKENDAYLIPFFLEKVAGVKSLNLPDGLHPNKEGYKIIADNVFKILLPILTASS